MLEKEIANCIRLIPSNQDPGIKNEFQRDSHPQRMTESTQILLTNGQDSIEATHLLARKVSLEIYC